MSRSQRGLDWAYDKDAAVNTDFFSEAEAVSGVEDTPLLEMQLSDEEKDAEHVEVRFDGDGFAYEPSEEAPDEVLGGQAGTDGTETRELRREIDALESFRLPGKVGATEWATTFAEIHTRVEDLGNHSKVTAIRYVNHGVDRKISSLPSVMDFLADVQIVARKCLSPALYRVWHKIYFEGCGTGAHRVPESVQIAIQQRCGTAWMRAQFLPFKKYWTLPTSKDTKRGEYLNLETNPRDVRAERNARRRARRAERKITTLAAAA